MISPMPRHGLLPALVAAAALVGAACPLLAELATPEEAAERLGLSQQAIERVKSGVDASLDRVYEFVKADRLAEFQTVTISRGRIDPANPSLAGLVLDDATLNELARDPGRLFFMSDDEARRVRAAGKQGTAQAQGAYREVLAERATAYWEQGLDGITPYAGKGRSPRVDLGHANAAARALVRNHDFLAELEAVPSKSPGKAEHQLLWAVQKGRDLAAPVLIHRILYREADGELYAERRFYSGADYDSLQIVIGLLPASAGRCAIFYTNRTYTAQVAGFGGGAKRSVGRMLLEKELVAEMQRAQKVVSGR
jgi:hypothetical protein